MAKEAPRLSRKRLEEKIKSSRSYIKKFDDKLSDSDSLTVTELCKLVSESEALSDKIDELETELQKATEEDDFVTRLQDKIATLESRLEGYRKTYGDLDL